MYPAREGSALTKGVNVLPLPRAPAKVFRAWERAGVRVVNHRSHDHRGCRIVRFDKRPWIEAKAAIARAEGGG